MQNDGLINLNVSTNRYSAIPNLVDTIQKFDISYNAIDTIDKELPPNIKEFECTDNHINDITVPFPDGITEINLENNLLKYMFEIPSSVILLNVGNNLLKTLGDIPNNVKELDCSNNFLTQISEKLKDRMKKGDLEITCGGNRFNTSTGFSRPHFVTGHRSEDIYIPQHMLLRRLHQPQKRTMPWVMHDKKKDPHYIISSGTVVI